MEAFETHGSEQFMETTGQLPVPSPFGGENGDAASAVSGDWLFDVPLFGAYRFPTCLPRMRFVQQHTVEHS